MTPRFLNELPCRLDDGGVVRVGTTRVGLDGVIEAFRDGASMEEVADRYPTVGVDAVRAIVTYYLRAPEEIDTYLEAYEADAGATQAEAESFFGTEALRERLHPRRRHE